MRTIVLSTVVMALIAASAPNAFAATSRHPARKGTATTSDQFRNARNAVQSSQPAWSYSGWSAPAGR